MTPTPPTENRDWKEELKGLLNDRRTGLRDSSDTNKTYTSIFALVEKEITTAEARGYERGYKQKEEDLFA